MAEQNVEENVGSVAAFRLQEETDGELIERTLGGDPNAFGLIVERHQRKIFRVINAIVRNDVEADGLTQDTFVQAYTHLARFQGRSELDTWLVRIAINKSRDFLRRRKFAALLGASTDVREGVMIEAVDERPGPEREIMSHQLRAAIERAQQKLSTQQKIIFRLRHYEDHSLEEIATMLGLQSGTVRAHLFRAIHKIREELAEWGSK